VESGHVGGDDFEDRASCSTVLSAIAELHITLSSFQLCVIISLVRPSISSLLKNLSAFTVIIYSECTLI